MKLTNIFNEICVKPVIVRNLCEDFKQGRVNNLQWLTAHYDKGLLCQVFRKLNKLSGTISYNIIKGTIERTVKGYKENEGSTLPLYNLHREYIIRTMDLHSMFTVVTGVDIRQLHFTTR